MRQGTIWDLLYPRKRIEKPIRLIEFFAGIGAQHKALSQLTEVESWRICEWAFNSYCSYNAIHIKDSTDYSEGKSRDELIERVRGTSSNYNEPIPDSQLKRKPIEWLRKAYNNIVATHNLVNIMEVHGKDLGIVDTDRYEYVLTYSFPCQDLSLAGKRKGMSVSQKEGGTRSGLLWEVERILSEIERDREPLPQVLVMENVPEVICTPNITDFKKWGHRLEQMGYTNYVEILNAKDYGIPQNRRRCFMVSLLGGYAYDFPMKMKREHVLKDLLERYVDRKYYLSDKHIERISNWKARQKPLENIEKNMECSPTLTARGAGEEHSGMVLVDTGLFRDGEVVDFDSSDTFRKECPKEDCPTLLTKSKFAVVEKEDAGLRVVGNYGNGYFSKNVYDSDGLSPTLTCGNHGLGTAIAVDETPNLKTQLCNRLIEEGKVREGDVIRHSYSSNRLENGDRNMGRVENHEGLSPTLDTRCDCLGVVVNEESTKKYRNYITWRNNKGKFNTESNRAMFENGLALTLATKEQAKVMLGDETSLRIRKLTPRECIRLMGFTDGDYDAMVGIGMTDSAIYHVAGDSIVVTVLMAIFGEMLGIDYREKIGEYVESEVIGR